MNTTLQSADMKNPVPFAYSSAFQTDEAARHYEESVYNAHSHDAFIWDLEREWLLGFVEGQVAHTPIVHLDFACGTGRVIAALENLTASSVGVDISPHMLAIARRKLTRAELREGDILSRPDLVSGSFDLITAFRFFLNADAPLRHRIMLSLSTRLRGEDSRLVFSVQGHSRSARHLSQLLHRKRGGPVAEMTDADIEALVKHAGLQIEAMHGFGLCPTLPYRTPLAFVARALDGALARRQWLAAWTYNRIYVCRRAL